jgi:hypothetical protein
MHPDEVESALELALITAEHTQRLANWIAGGRQGPRPRKRLTTAQRAKKRAYRKWYDSWCRPGDAPSRGHMRRRSHR